MVSGGAGEFLFNGGGISFSNVYNVDWSSWTGFSISNTTDVTTAGWTNQYSSFTGGGFAGSSNYAIFYESGEINLTTALRFN